MTPASTALITDRIKPATFSVANLTNLVKTPRLVFGVALALALVFALTVALSTSAGAQAFNIIYKFRPLHDGHYPQGNLISDASGNLYGITEGNGDDLYGTVFQLIPPALAGGAWTETVIHQFTSGVGGWFPVDGVVMDKSGNLYGVTAFGGGMSCYWYGCGIAYQLKPPVSPGGAWTFSTIHLFTGRNGDGGEPDGGLIISSAGILYGTTLYGGSDNKSDGGTAFQIQPSGSGFTETVIHNFGATGDGESPEAALTLDQFGNLYGTTRAGGRNNYGTVFELSPPINPGDPWTEAVLYSFRVKGFSGYSPAGAALVLDNGYIYGTTHEGNVNKNGGTIFRLSKPSPGSDIWRFEVLHTFNANTRTGVSPVSLTLDPNNHIFYGINFLTYAYLGCGNIYSLAPPAVPGDVWQYTVVHSFTNYREGCNSNSQLLRDSANNYYGTTTIGGSVPLNGTVFEFTP